MILEIIIGMIGKKIISKKYIINGVIITDSRKFIFNGVIITDSKTTHKKEENL